MKKLRRVDDDVPDVVVGIRLFLRQDGSWEILWDANSYVYFEDVEQSQGTLPPGVAEAIIKEFSFKRAAEVGGTFAATIGAKAAQAAIDTLFTKK